MLAYADVAQLHSYWWNATEPRNATRSESKHIPVDHAKARLSSADSVSRSRSSEARTVGTLRGLHRSSVPRTMGVPLAREAPRVATQGRQQTRSARRLAA